jgi:hypothetical protein
MSAAGCLKKELELGRVGELIVETQRVADTHT